MLFILRSPRFEPEQVTANTGHAPGIRLAVAGAHFTEELQTRLGREGPEGLAARSGEELAPDGERVVFVSRIRS